RARERAGGEGERGAGGAGERVAVALLPLRDGAVAAQRGERLVVAGVVRRIGREDAPPVVHVAAGERDAPERAIVRGDGRRRTEGTVIALELAVRDAVDHARRLAGGLRRVHEVAHPAVARCQHTRREDEVGCEAAEARERGRGEQDARPREPDRQVVREGEDPPRSEERRVGKEGRARRTASPRTKKSERAS